VPTALRAARSPNRASTGKVLRKNPQDVS